MPDLPGRGTTHDDDCHRREGGTYCDCKAGRVATPPECRCAESGQPMTDLGVMHVEDCPWLVWFRSTGGCMGDPDA